jgi:hypothetical protein
MIIPAHKVDGTWQLYRERLGKEFFLPHNVTASTWQELIDKVSAYVQHLDDPYIRRIVNAQQEVDQWGGRNGDRSATFSAASSTLWLSSHRRRMVHYIRCPLPSRRATLVAADMPELLGLKCQLPADVNITFICQRRRRSVKIDQSGVFHILGHKPSDWPKVHMAEALDPIKNECRCVTNEFAYLAGLHGSHVMLAANQRVQHYARIIREMHTISCAW